MLEATWVYMPLQSCTELVFSRAHIVNDSEIFAYSLPSSYVIQTPHPIKHRLIADNLGLLAYLFSA